jgi:hypothetical protein
MLQKYMGLARYARRPAARRCPPSRSDLRQRAGIRPAGKNPGADDNRYPTARVPKLCLAANVRSPAVPCHGRTALGPAVARVRLAGPSSQVSLVFRPREQAIHDR